MELVTYGGMRNCVRLANGDAELIVTTAVGPRVIRFGFVGGENLFMESPEALAKTGGDDWRLYGGHRLWHSPEHPVRTYWPDNQPVAYEMSDGALRVTQPVEPTTGIEKQIEIRLADSGTRVEVQHRLTNRGMWEVALAPWALTVMAPGGFAVLPQEPFKPHTEELLPARPLVLWPYVDMADPRWTWGTRFVILRQDPARGPQKIGVRNTRGWMAYVLRGQLFVKRSMLVPGAAYPDDGCNFEAFTNEHMLEVETLGPLERLAPGAAIEHPEVWSLHRAEVADNEASLAEKLLPLV
jgi:hypothetical protein